MSAPVALDAPHDLRARWREAAEEYAEEYLDESDLTAEQIAGYRRRMECLTITVYGALRAHTADDSPPQNPPSLATCKRSANAGAVPDSPNPALSRGELPHDRRDLEPWESDMLGFAFAAGVEDVERAARLVRGGGDRHTALLEVAQRDQKRREKVVALLDAGEVAHALRVATCGRRSVELLCPEDAGGCGADQNFVPISCGSRICRDCQDKRLGEEINKWKEEVRGMDHPTLSTYTIENVSDPAKGRAAILGALGRLRSRTIPFEGETVRDGARKRWCWWRDGGEPAQRWKVKLQEAGEHDLARRLQEEYVFYEWEDVTGYHRGRNIPFDEVVSGGLIGVDVKQKGPDEFNVHAHVVEDMAWIPQPALSSVWEDLTGSPVVDVRRIYDRSESGAVDALKEVLGYALKPPEFEDLEAEIEFVKTTKGCPMVHPFGELHGNAAEVGQLLRCAHCDGVPLWWDYLGIVDGRHDNMGKDWDGNRGKDPPD